MSREQRKGFTLIELLIVVAIIAILAAIAVPNFLEAQMRAKISRAKADMRTVATGLEAYRIDYQGYPNDNSMKALYVITTPVAYLTHVPEDPFAFEISYGWASMGGGPLSFTYCNADEGGWYGREAMKGGRHEQLAKPGWALWDPPRDQFSWALTSPGPDIRCEYDRADVDGTYLDPHFVGSALYYDATNGTVSRGDLLVFGPGNVGNPTPEQLQE